MTTAPTLSTPRPEAGPPDGTRIEVRYRDGHTLSVDLTLLALAEAQLAGIARTATVPYAAFQVVYCSTELYERHGGDWRKLLATTDHGGLARLVYQADPVEDESDPT